MNVNALAPPKAKRRLCGTAFRKFQLLGAYHALDLVQEPFSFVFWLLEKGKAQLQDRIDNEDHDE